MEIHDTDIGEAIGAHLQLAEGNEVVRKSKNILDEKQKHELESVNVPAVKSSQIVHENATVLENLKRHIDLEDDKEFEAKAVSYCGLKRGRTAEIHRDMDANERNKYSDNQEVKRLKLSHGKIFEMSNDASNGAEFNFRPNALVTVDVPDPEICQTKLAFCIVPDEKCVKDENPVMLNKIIPEDNTNEKSLANHEKQNISQETEANISSVKYDKMKYGDVEFISLDEDNFCKDYQMSDTENQGSDIIRMEAGSKAMEYDEDEKMCKQSDSLLNENKTSLSEFKVENTESENKDKTIGEYKKESSVLFEMDDHKIDEAETLKFDTKSKDKSGEFESEMHEKLLELELINEKNNRPHGDLQETFQEVSKRKRPEAEEETKSIAGTEAKIAVTSEMRPRSSKSGSTASWSSSGESFTQTSHDVGGDVYAIFGSSNRESGQPPPPGTEELPSINAKQQSPSHDLLPVPTPTPVDCKRPSFPVFRKPSVFSRRSWKISEQPLPPGCDDAPEDTWLPSSKNVPVPDKNNSLKAHKRKKLDNAAFKADSASLFQPSSFMPSSIVSTRKNFYEIPSSNVNAQTGPQKQSENHKPNNHSERVVFIRKSINQIPKDYSEQVVDTKKSENQKPKDHSERVVVISSSQRHGHSKYDEPSSKSERIIYVSGSKERKQSHQNEQRYHDNRSPESTASSSHAQQSWINYSSQAAHEPQTQTLPRILPYSVQVPFASILSPSMPPQPATNDISTLKASIFAATGLSDKTSPATTKSFSNTSAKASISNAGSEDLPFLVNKLKQVTQMLQLKQVLDGIATGQPTASSTMQPENQPVAKIDQYEMEHAREQRHSDYDLKAQMQEYYNFQDNFGGHDNRGRCVFDEKEDYRRWLEVQSRDAYYRQEEKYRGRPPPELPYRCDDKYYDHPHQFQGPQNRGAIHRHHPYHIHGPSHERYNFPNLDRTRLPLDGSFNDCPKERPWSSTLHRHSLPNFHEYVHGTLVKPVNKDRDPYYDREPRPQNVAARYPPLGREHLSDLPRPQQTPLFSIAPEHISPSKPSVSPQIQSTPTKPVDFTMVSSRSGKVVVVQQGAEHAGSSQQAAHFRNA